MHMLISYLAMGIIVRRDYRHETAVERVIKI
jgi:hypothetical protein